MQFRFLNFPAITFNNIVIFLKFIFVFTYSSLRCSVGANKKI